MQCTVMITYVGVLCPGGTGDSRAYQALRHFIDGLSPGFYAVADNAYTLSEHLIIPYCGVDRLDKSKDVQLIQRGEYLV